MTRGADGSEARAAEVLIVEHLPDIVTLCNRMFRHASDAQDATHEAVLGILRALPTYRGDGPVRHWLLKVALNAARAHRRNLSRKAEREQPLDEHEEPGAVMRNQAEERDEQETLRVAISELPDALRETVVLYHFHRLTQVEVGGLLGCSQKTVHQRLGKGLEKLRARLGGGGALGAMVALPGGGGAVLDVVSPALQASVEESVAGYYAATTAVTGGGATAVTAGSMLTAGAVTGGLVMQAKLMAGAAAIAVSCLIGGAVLSDRVLAGGDDAQSDARIAELQRQLDDGQRDMQALRDQLEDRTSRRAARLNSLAQENERLLHELAEKERALAAFGDDDREPAATIEAVADATDVGRAAQWAELQDKMAGIFGIFQKMGEEGASQFELGPQLVVELSKLSREEFDEIMDFDASETDPGRLEDIRAVMLQALIFVPHVSEKRNDYMARYLDRAQNGGYGERFTNGMLRRAAFSMPPFVDGYAKIIEPLDEDVKARFVEEALDRAARGGNESLRLDGTVFLAHVDDPRATTELIRVFETTSNSQRLRAAALKGLGTRASADVLRALRDAEVTEDDEALRTAITQAAQRVEKALAK